jgi:hypothetical protein
MVHWLYYCGPEAKLKYHGRRKWRKKSAHFVVAKKQRDRERKTRRYFRSKP